MQLLKNLALGLKIVTVLTITYL